MRLAIKGCSYSRDRANLYDALDLRLGGRSVEEGTDTLNRRTNDGLRWTGVGHVERRGNMNDGVDAVDGAVVGAGLRG